MFLNILTFLLGNSSRGAYEKQTQTQTHGQSLIVRWIFFLLGMVWLLSNCKRIQDSSFQDVWFIEYHLPIHFYPKYPKKNGFVFSKVGIPSTDPKTRPRHVLFPGLLLRPDGFPLGSGDPFGRTVRWMGLRKQLQLISYNSVWKIKGALWSLCVLVWV